MIYYKSFVSIFRFSLFLHSISWETKNICKWLEKNLCLRNWLHHDVWVTSECIRHTSILGASGMIVRDTNWSTYWTFISLYEVPLLRWVKRPKHGQKMSKYACTQGKQLLKYQRKCKEILHRNYVIKIFEKLGTTRQKLIFGQTLSLFWRVNFSNVAKNPCLPILRQYFKF